MKKIVGILRPFDINQELFAYEDGNLIGRATTTTDNLFTDLMTLATQYEITRVDLTGPNKYIKGIKEQLETKEMAMYDVNKLEINII